MEILKLKYPYLVELKHITNKSLPVIYVITPTYKRLVLRAELTRLSNTLRLVPNLHWIVVEDSASNSIQVTQLLHDSGISFTHLHELTPSNYKLNTSDPNWLKPRGVLQRNRALQWLHDNQIPGSKTGVVYFADDDNTYDIHLFEEVCNFI